MRGIKRKRIEPPGMKNGKIVDPEASLNYMKKLSESGRITPDRLQQFKIHLLRLYAIREAHNELNNSYRR